MQENAGQSSDLADLSGRNAARNQLMRIEETRVDLAVTQDLVKPLCLRSEDMSAGNRPGQEISKWRHHDEPTSVDDHDVVDGLGDLRENVTRHQDSSSRRCELAEKLTKPMHALRVESIRRFVENQQLRDLQGVKRRARAAVSCPSSNHQRGGEPLS